MSDAVASLKVMISGSAAGLVQSTNTASSAVEKMSNKVEGSSLGGGIASASMGFLKMTGAIGAATLAADVLKAGFNAATSVASSMVGQVGQAFERIGNTADIAASVGVTSQALAGLSHAAADSGVDMEGMGAALTQMNNRLAEAAMKGGATADTLKSVGLDAAKLASSTPDQAFLSIADAISKVENPMQRTQVAMDLFGKSGAKLLPMMMQGADGIRTAQEEAAKMGFAISDVDSSKVDAAGDAMGKVGRLIEGVANTIAVQLSPYITAASEGFLSWATSGTTVSQRVVQGIEWISKAIASLIDYGNLVMSMWETMKFAALGLASVVFTGFEKMAQGIAGMFNGIIETINWAIRKSNEILGTSIGEIETRLASSGKANGIAESLKAQSMAALDAANAYDKAFSRGDASAKVGKFFDDIKSKADAAAKSASAVPPVVTTGLDQMASAAAQAEKVAEALAKIRTESEQAGMTGIQKQIEDLKKLGATAADVAEAQKLLNGQESLKAMDEMQKKGQQTYEATRTNEEKLAAQKKDLAEQLVSGAINQNTYDRAIADAEKSLTANEASAPQSPSFTSAGSQAAANMIAQFQNQGAKDRIPQQQLAEQKKTTSAVDSLATAIAAKPWGLAAI